MFDYNKFKEEDYKGILSDGLSLLTTSSNKQFLNPKPISIIVGVKRHRQSNKFKIINRKISSKELSELLPFGRSPSGWIKSYIGNKFDSFYIRVIYDNGLCRDWKPNSIMDRTNIGL